MKERRERERKRIELIAVETVRSSELICSMFHADNIYIQSRDTNLCWLGHAYIFRWTFFLHKLSLKSDVHAFLSMQRFFFRCVISTREKEKKSLFWMIFSTLFTMSLPSDKRYGQTVKRLQFLIRFTFFFGIKTADTKFVFCTKI